MGAVKKLNAYIALAHYLNPGNPADGVRQIDLALLEMLRHRDRRRNWHWACYRLSGPVLGIGTSISGVPWLYKTIGVTLPAQMTMAGRLGAALLVIGLLLFALWWSLDGNDEKTLAPPPVIAEWLEAHDKTGAWPYWAEAFWPYGKYRANRTQFWFLTFWRNSPVALVA